MVDSFKNQASDNCLYERVTESLTHLIHSKTWIVSVSKHCCVVRRHKTVLLWLWLKISQQTWAKQSILYDKLHTLCLLNSQWRTSTPRTCLQVDVSVSVPSKRTRSEMRCFWFEAALRRSIGHQVPREHFESMWRHLLSWSAVVL